MSRNDRPSGAPGLDGPLSEALVGTRRFFTRAEVSEDKRSLHAKGGRAGDAFYRDRWSHDKVVRSTHGVNCTGSCSWKVYVKDGIITWEAQQTDYPSTGADRPEYEPRGCPRGAAFSWYTYSPTRIRYPYVRGVLLEMYREAKARLGDPVLAWADIVGDPEKAKRYKSARGKGGLVRASWGEAAEIVAAANVHTIKQWGPDRVAGFSPIPAMSMVSHASGARFTSLIGGSMLSFYDWYADLPVASPQIWGDQTDVPESGDWWDAGYLIMWGSNVPVTRTPDAHWMAEARYRGQKVVVVSPDYADNVKFADEWLPAAPGTDGALAMAMGHVVLKEFFVDRQVEFFEDYTRRFTDLPFLLELEPYAAKDGSTASVRYRPGKFLTAADLGGDEAAAENAAFKTVLVDSRTGDLTVPNGTLGDRFGDSGVGKWNLDLGDVVPALSLLTTRDDTALVDLPRFDLPDGSVERAAPWRPGPAGRGQAGDHCLRPPARAVRRCARGPSRRVARRLRRRGRPLHPGLAGADHLGARRGRGPPGPGVRAERRGHPGPLHDHRGGRHQPLVPLGHHLPLHAPADDHHRLPGRNGGGWAHYVGQEKARPITGLGADGLRPRLGAAAAADDPDGLLVPPHRPVPLRPLHG